MEKFFFVATVPEPLSISAQLKNLKTVDKLKIYIHREDRFKTYIGIGTLAPSFSIHKLAEELKTIAESTPFSDISLYPLEEKAEIQILKEHREAETELILH